MLEQFFVSPDHLDATLAIALTTLGFIIFWSVASSPRIIPWLTNWYTKAQAQEYKIYIQRLVGMVFYGLVPIFIFFQLLGRSGPDFGLVWHLSLTDIWWTVGLSAIAIPLTYIGAKKEECLAMYPEVRSPIWGRRILVLSALCWVAYLFFYELLFRGFLLFSCERAFGPVAAITINTALYSLVHVPKRMTEGIGAIFFGIVSCVVTLSTGTIWVTLLIHIVLSLANEWYALRFNPSIRYVP